MTSGKISHYLSNIKAYETTGHWENANGPTTSLGVQTRSREFSVVISPLDDNVTAEFSLKIEVAEPDKLTVTLLQ